MTPTYQNPHMVSAKSRANLIPAKPGDVRNPQGFTNAGQTIKKTLNEFSSAGLTEEQLRIIARNRTESWVRRAAAERALRTLEVGDLADMGKALGNDDALKELRDSGVNTEVVKRYKTTTRIVRDSKGDPITEVERQIELHDRAGQDFDRIMDRTEGKPKQVADINLTGLPAKAYLGDDPSQEV